jgi:hypothetical protein
MTKHTRQPAITPEVIRSWSSEQLLKTIALAEQLLAETRYGIRAVVDGKVTTIMTRANVRKSLALMYVMTDRGIHNCQTGPRRDEDFGNSANFPAADLERLYKLDIDEK